MTRGSQARALAWATGLAAAGAVIAYLLAAGPWAIAGVAIGAITGSFAPSVYVGFRDRTTKRSDLRGAFEQAPTQSTARLLDPRRELVGFLGRQDELAALVAWCKDDHAGRLRLVTGPGGVGKTRLSIELGARMEKLGWTCERVADGQEASAIGAMRAVTGSRALLVVDYAEARIGLRQMLTALSSDEGDRVRVLLLARSTGDWWDQLGVGEPAVWDIVQAARQTHLSLSPVVAAGMSDVDVIALAVRSFARQLGRQERTVEVYGDSGLTRRRMLDLHAAALVAVLDDADTGPVRVNIRTVLGELLRHEQHFWFDSARARGLPAGLDGTTTRVLRQLVAVACLLGAASEEEARVLPDRVPGMSPSVKLAEWLRALYPPDPGQTDWLGTLQPDRLAELHTLRELAGSPELGQACLAGLDARQAVKAVTLLARASSDYPEAEVLLSQTLPDVADVIVGMQEPLETLTAIFNAIPYPTVVLAPAAVALGQQIASGLPADTAPEVRARWLASLAVRLSGLGRYTDALGVAQEAVAIRRELAAGSPDQQGPDLALSLTNLGEILSKLGRAAEALAVTEEAVAIRRELPAANPDQNRRDLAATLHNLGVRYSELRRPARALSATEEAVAIRRELAAASPDRYRRDLAASLHTLGNRFSALGRPGDALAVTEEAVAIRRELAAASPDQHGPDLAHSLNNLGNRLSALGRPGDALLIAEEAVAIHRELAAASPDRYRPDLAMSLNNLGIRLSALGRPGDALAVTEEAVAIRRELAAASPERYRPDLAASLNNLGVRLSALGRPDDALQATEEAVAIRRELAAASPDRYRPDLATCLNNLGLRLSALGRPDDALQATEEAVSIRRELAAAIPGPYRADLACSLTDLGVTLSALGRPGDALSAEREAVAIYRELATAGPDRYRPDLARSLSNLGVTFSELGRPGDALTAEREAVAVYRELAAVSPSEYGLKLADSLHDISEVYDALDRKADGDAARKEAARLRAQPDR